MKRGSLVSQDVYSNDKLQMKVSSYGIQYGKGSKYFSRKLNMSGNLPGRVAQSVGHLTRKSGVLGSIPGLATYFRFSFRFFKKGSCQLLAKVCARSTG